MNKLVSVVCFAVFLITCSFGCSGKPSRPPMGLVRGKVTYNGAPVANASIAFLADGASRMAIGTSDDDGNYELSSYEPNDGAIVGTHVVTVTKSAVATQELSTAPIPSDYQSTLDATQASKLQTAQQIEHAEKAKPLLPPKYASHSTSDMKKEVKEGVNEINLELVD